MAIWICAPVTVEPDVTLEDWRIYETCNTTRHFVGVRVGRRTGRVSSAIVQFDRARLIGVTRSGRIYQLKGSPGFNEDAQYVWEKWRMSNRVCSFKDISKAMSI